MVNTTVLPSGQTSPCQREDTVFDTWQPRYAARGIPTFPVRFEVLPSGKVDKRPMVKHWQKFGLRGSTELTRRFADAQGVGIALGIRNGLAIVDVDTTDENVVADVLSYYGPSPLIARSPTSGGHHIYYRHNGRQRRKVRDSYWQQRGAPVDVLGNGLIVAPASRAPTGVYRFVQGDIDDLHRLPVLRTVAASEPVVQEQPQPEQPEPTTTTSTTIPVGRRNTELFRHCMRQALTVRSLAELLTAAHTFNQNCLTPPLDDDEMRTTAHSAWHYTESGNNHFGQHGAWLGFAEIATMLRNDQDAMLLLAVLRAHNGPWATFMCANGLDESFGWTRKRLATARARLIELGHLEPVRQAGGRGHPAVFRWRLTG